MALQITRWSPDTCGCIVEYEWDDALNENNRVHTIKSIIRDCPAHQGQTVAQIHAALFDENPRKNKMLERIRATISTLTTTDSLGNVVLKDGAVKWSFDTNRVLQISTVPTLTATQRNSAQSWADTNLGLGKVKIN